jgi:hypothetical protein
VDESGRDLIKGTVLTFVWRLSKTTKTSVTINYLRAEI